MIPKVPTNTPLSASELDDFIDSFWEELEEATQDDQEDPSVWEEK